MHLGGTRGSFLLYIISLLYDNTSCYVILCQVLPVRLMHLGGTTKCFLVPLHSRNWLVHLPVEVLLLWYFHKSKLPTKMFKKKTENDSNCDSSNVDIVGVASRLYWSAGRSLQNILVQIVQQIFLVETIYSLTLGAIALSHYGEKYHSHIFLFNIWVTSNLHDYWMQGTIYSFMFVGNPDLDQVDFLLSSSYLSLSVAGRLADSLCWFLVHRQIVIGEVYLLVHKFVTPFIVRLCNKVIHID
jgi:hypothetical protein